MVLKMLYLICTCKIQITKFKKYKSWNPKDWWLVWASLWLAVEVLREPIWGQLPGNNYWARLRGVSEFVLLKIFHLYHTRSLIHSYRRSCQDLPSLKRICMAFSRTIETHDVQIPNSLRPKIYTPNPNCRCCVLKMLPKIPQLLLNRIWPICQITRKIWDILNTVCP